MRVVYQGAPGAYSHGALRRKYPDSAASGLTSFAAVAADVASGSAELGLLPVENTIVGEVTAATAALSEWPGLVVVERFRERIHHCLAALPGADIESLAWAESHPVALAQCARWLSARRLKPHQVEDTAGAARAIAADRDWTRAAICSAAAAESYGLEVLAREIADTADNYTAFVVIARRPASAGLAA